MYGSKRKEGTDVRILNPIIRVDTIETSYVAMSDKGLLELCVHIYRTSYYNGLN